MRKIIVVGGVTALVAGALALPASASFDHHFTVLEKQVSSERISRNTFRFKNRLVDPRNHRNRVGRDRGRCTFAHGKGRCRAKVHLDGEIGGFGDLFVRGDIGRHDRRLNVVGGTDDFDGVAGKMLLRQRGSRPDKLHFDLVH